MRALFAAIAARPNRQMLDAEWEKTLGGELVAALRARNLLEAAGVHGIYPCDSPIQNCNRKVEPNRLPGATCPYVAYCTDEDPGCLELDLDEDQLQASRFVPQNLLRLLQARFGLATGEPEVESRLDSTWALGRSAWGGIERVVLVSWAGRRAEFEGFLAKLQLGTGPALVLVPQREALTAEVQKAHDRGHLIEVVGFDQVLAFEAGGFVLTEAVRQRLGAPTLAAPAAVPARESFFCLAQDERGERKVALAEYRDLVAGAEKVDLFLDLMATAENGNPVGGRRDPDGTYRPAVLKPMEALAVAEVMSTPNPLRRSDFNIISNQPGQAFQAGRKALDIQLEHQKWRSFPTLFGDVATQNRFAFRPPAGLRYLLLQPLVPVHRDPEVLARKRARTNGIHARLGGG